VRKQWGHTFDKKIIKGNDFAFITMKTKKSKHREVGKNLATGRVCLG